MDTQAAPGEASSKLPATSLWQLALVALSLCVFALFVLLPVGLLLSLLAGGVGLGIARDLLLRFGALEPAAFGGAVYLAGAILLMGVLWAAGAVMVVGLLRLAGRPAPSIFSPLRWPWLLFGLLLLSAATLLGGLRELPGIRGALALSLVTWVVLSAVHLLFKVSVSVVSFSWRLSCASPFAAGLVTLMGLGSTLALYTLGAVQADYLSRQRRQLPSIAAPTCYASELECLRRALLGDGRPWLRGTRRTTSLASARPRGYTDALTPGDFAAADEEGSAGGGEGLSTSDDPSSSIRRCLEDFANDRTLAKEAYWFSVSRVGEQEAAELLNATLLSVCARGGPFHDFRQFLLTSLRNRAATWWRGQARSCSLQEAPEPVCDMRPDDEYMTAETQLAVRQALCRLSESDQELLRLSHFDELDDQEIARRRGITYAAARKQLERARRRLQVEFLQQCQ